jgi:hypothetical protein
MRRIASVELYDKCAAAEADLNRPLGATCAETRYFFLPPAALPMPTVPGRAAKGDDCARIFIGR